MATWKDFTKTKLTQNDWSLLIANLVPVIGAWFFNWSVKDVFLVYCLETIITGLFTLLKLLVSGLIKKKDIWQNQGSTSKQPFWFFMLFFIVHYGFFVAIQMGLFFAVSGIGDQYGITFFNFISKWPALLSGDTYIMLAVFIAGYGYRTIKDFILSGEYRTASLGFLMFQPYGRIFIQQVTVILGSMFLSLGAGKLFILVFAAIKIFFEVFMNLESLIGKAARSELKSTDE